MGLDIIWTGYYIKYVTSKRRSGGDLEKSIVARGVPPIPDPCYRCRFFEGILLDDEAEDYEEPDTNVYCKAFPNGIPKAIQNGKNDHSKPLAGQKNKIVFKELR